MASSEEHHVIRNLPYHADEPLRCGTRRDVSGRRECGLTPQYALVYLSSGGATLEMEGVEPIRLERGDAFQRFPDRAHYVRYDHGCLTHYMAVPREVLVLMRDLGVQSIDRPVIHVGTRHRFLHRHAELIEALRAAPPYRLMRVLTDIQSLMVDMHIQSMGQGANPGLPSWLEQAYLILSSDLHIRMDMPEVALELGVGYSLFRKQFKSACGMAPNDYRVRRRVERAQEMVLQGQTLTTIARDLGYKDVYAFSSQFKRFVGAAPRNYRSDSRT